MTPHFLQRPNAHRGAATLVVVMMLFLVMALLAAYANRSLLFEQRIAISYGRASLSQEVAEGGIEWTLAQLNGTAIDTTCKTVDSGGQRFVDRYFQFDVTNRSIASKPAYVDGVVDCARDAANQGWACRCPVPSPSRTPAPALDAQPESSFVVQMLGVPTLRSGTIQLNIVGCTDSVVDNCLQKSSEISKALVSKAWASTLIGLVSAVRSPPAAPLVVKGGIDSSGAGGLGLHNTDPRSGGPLAVLGGVWNSIGLANARLDSVPGSSPGQAVVQNDEPLAKAPDAAHVFKTFMGISVDRYKQHPALRTITCSADCSGAVEDAYKAGKRILWVDGPMAISSSKVFGSVNDPLLVIATGDVTLSGSFQFAGMLVSQGDVNWTNTAGAAPLLTGVMVVGGSMKTVGTMDIVYQQAVTDQLRNRMGSYVRVSGSWIDEPRL